MSRSLETRVFLVACALALMPEAIARAQFGGAGGGGMRPMGPGGAGAGQPPPPEEKEQAAEAAPETPTGQEPALQPLPAWPGQKEKALQFFQLSGYLRGRTYFFHQLDLGQGAPGPSSSGIVQPFYTPFSENSATASCAARNSNTCRSPDITSADMRFRLEPTINVSDQVRVKAQIDVFDNLVLGSTPEGWFINGLNPSREVPLAAFSKTQVPQTAGVYAFQNSIVAKRAWAEVRTPIGELRFGRMPSHWGTGMFVNNGECLDCDFGVNVDRIMFATKAFNHFLVLGYDWVATGPTTALFNPNQTTGVQYSADPLVYVQQVEAAIGRQDRPEELREKVSKGKVVVNYGAYLVGRWQGWDLSTNPGANMPGGVASTGESPQTLAKSLVPRNAWAFIPDLWFRLAYKKLNLEAEGVMIFGQIKNLDDQSVAFANGGLDILQGGWVARGDYRFLHDQLHIGLEVGGASGDAAEDPNAVINVRKAMPIHSKRVTNFMFDPDYHVDLILWRRLVGTVTNATYFKPRAQYDILDNLSAGVDVIYSIANVPVGWPGNDANLGLEIDGAVWYHNDEEGFSAGVAYGVLFPFAGLRIRGDIYGVNFDPQTAQTVQARIAVKF
jgi:uncharacterized protein (TIGR04551 family)